MPTIAMEQKSKKKVAPMSVDDLCGMHMVHYDYFAEIRERARDNKKYKIGEHFDDLEQNEITDQNRIPYSIPLTAAKINQIASYQKENRTEWDAKATIDPNDEIKAAIYNLQLRDIEKRTQMRWIESDVFETGISVYGFGVVEIFLDTDKDLRSIPSLRVVHSGDFIWDANSVKYDRSDAVFQAKVHRVTRRQLVTEYGYSKKRVKDLTAGADNFLWDSGRENYFVYEDPNGDPENDIINVFTHYQKTERRYYYGMFNDYQNLFGMRDNVVAIKSRSKDAVRKKLREMEVAYMDKGLIPQNMEIVERVEEGIDKYVFTYEEILEYEETELPTFPFYIYNAYWYYDRVWSLTDTLKSAQKFVDRYIQQIDYSLGKDIKNVYEVDVTALAEGFTYDDAISAAEDSGFIPVKRTNSLRAIRGYGANPQWMQMVDVMKSYIEDLAGGRSFQGLAEGANEPGVAIARKQRFGEMVATPLMDNLARWKKNLGEGLMWWFKNYDTMERVIKISGGELSPEMMDLLSRQPQFTPSQTNPRGGYFTINQGGTSHLDNADFEITISERSISETHREKKLSQLMLTLQAMPDLAAIPKMKEKILEYIGLDYNDRAEIIEEYRNLIAAQAEQQRADSEAQLAIEQQKADADTIGALSNVSRNTNQANSTSGEKNNNTSKRRISNRRGGNKKK